MIKLLKFHNLFPPDYILAKTRSRMTTAIMFSRHTQYWENVVLVVVLVLESKAL